MAKENVPNYLKSIGVTEMERNGGKVELYLDPSKNRKIASGFSKAIASTNVMANAPFSADYFEGPGSFTRSFTFHQKVRLAMQYFTSEPLVGKIVELMTVLANDGFKNEDANQKRKAYFDAWGKAVDLNLVFKWIFLEYFRSGNVPVMRKLVRANQDFGPLYGDLAVAAKKHNYTKQMIPGAYTVLNPLAVYVTKVTGYEEQLVMGTKEMRIDANFSGDPTDFFIKSLPEDLDDRLKAKLVENKTIPLDKKNVKRILRMRQPYEPYGKIMMERAFAAIHEKNKLRQMDMSMVNSVINQIIKVTVGNDQYPASPRQLKNLAQQFQNIGKSQIIFWNHTLNIEVIRPDTKVLNNDKYERVNQDIRNAFGISDVLIGTGGARMNLATALMSVKTFITNLGDAREDVLRWLEGEYADIAEAMGFDGYPKPSFNPLSLTDEIQEKQIIMGLVDRGIVSFESAQERLGYDPAVEKRRQTREVPDKEAGIIGMMSVPFQQSKEESAPVKEKKDEKNNKPEKKVKGVEGRPKTPAGKKMNERRITKAKASEEIEEDEEETSMPELLMTVASEKSSIQSYLFPKEEYTKEEAIKWLENHNLSTKKIDEAKNFHRARQFPPGHCDKESYAVIKLTNSKGIKAVICKKSSKASASSLFDDKMNADSELEKEVVLDIASEYSK